MPEDSNNLQSFWKFPAELSSLVKTVNGCTLIGDLTGDLPAAAPQGRKKLCTVANGVRLYACMAALNPGPAWKPLVRCEQDGSVVVWQSTERQAFLFPFNVEQAISDLLTEKYREADLRGSALQHLHRVYYRLRPWIPRAIQMRLKRGYTGVQAKLEFPAWPVEHSVEWLRTLALWCLVRASGMGQFPVLGFWPGDKRFCVTLTHDVETAAGVANIRAVADIERRLGFRSSWNFVPERYQFDSSILIELRREGFEIGVHGLNHDGRLFESRRIFEHRAERINRYAREWGAVGFRSPACQRNYAWMKDVKLQFSYDSSFPDTDPYQPMPGGCCSTFPWFLGDVVELPITLPQDHVIFDVLGEKSARLWREKLDHIESVGGLANIIVHPDYMISGERLRCYEDFLILLKAKERAWCALPGQVAAWWRTRASTEIVDGGESAHVRTSYAATCPEVGITSIVAGAEPGDLRFESYAPTAALKTC